MLLSLVGHVFIGFSAQPNYNTKTMKRMQLWNQTQSCIMQTMINKFTAPIVNQYSKTNHSLVCYDTDKKGSSD